MSDKRSAWHAEAIAMKREGVTLSVIAARFGKSRVTVSRATKGVKSLHLHRRGKPNHSARLAKGIVTNGTSTGVLKRVAISFSDKQIERINTMAAEEGISFSFAVSKLVDVALLQRGRP